MDQTTVVPSLSPATSDFSLDRLLHPARHFHHPEEVVSDTGLDVQAKRAILSSWASDACAVESMPALRKPPGVNKPVSFDEVMDALRRLDRLAALAEADAPERRRKSDSLRHAEEAREGLQS